MRIRASILKNVNLKTHRACRRICTLERGLLNWIASGKRVAVVGVGNEMRRDDAVGVQVARKLQGKLSRQFRLIEAGTIPESYIDKVREFEPTHVLIIDAAQLGTNPGNSRLLSPRKVKGLSISTHTLPLNVFAEFVKRETGSKVKILAIQPKDLEFGEGMTDELTRTAEELTAILLRVDGCLGPKRRARKFAKSHKREENIFN